MTFWRQGPKTDRVYTAVYAVQSADASAVPDLIVVQAERNQLPGRNHAVLAIGQLRDHTVERLRFPGIISGFVGRDGIKSRERRKTTPSVAGGSMGGCR
ncbi:MAG: hypothetical protein ACTHMY_23550 [Solirubrobacteraceae bacterium]